MSFLAVALAVANPVWVGKFEGTGAPPAPWRLAPLGDGTAPTIYRRSMVGGVAAVEAQVNSSMALLVRPVAVDFEKTPILCWRWYVDQVVAKGDLQTKKGNDFAARIYVGFDMPSNAMSAATRFKLSLARGLYGRDLPDAAVTYVWDNRSPVGAQRKSAFTDRSQLIVAQSGASEAKSWVSERADVAADFARSFGGKPGRPVHVAIASDGDNTRSKGHAAFADIHFVARGQPCAN